MSFAAVAVGVGSAVAGAAVSSALAPSPSSGGPAGGGAAGAADPFASQRPAYQTQLNTLMQGGDPASKMLQPGYQFSPSDPSYQFRLNSGLDAVNAKSAASGMLNSGNRMLALQEYGQQSASQEFSNEYQRTEADYSNQFSRLSQLAGANSGSPAAAGQIIAGQNQQSQAGASAIGNAVGTAVNTVGNGYVNGGAAQPGSFATDGSSGVGSNNFGFTSGVSDPSYGAGNSYSAFGYGG